MGKVHNFRSLAILAKQLMEQWMGQHAAHIQEQVLKLPRCRGWSLYFVARKHGLMKHCLSDETA